MYSAPQHLFAHPGTSLFSVCSQIHTNRSAMITLSSGSFDHARVPLISFSWSSKVEKLQEILCNLVAARKKWLAQHLIDQDAAARDGNISMIWIMLVLIQIQKWGSYTTAPCRVRLEYMCRCGFGTCSSWTMHTSVYTAVKSFLNS